MDHLALCQEIKKHYESLPKQERQAASFVLDHPQEVAVISMREQARLAGIPPSTMTRFAKRLGLSGYDDIRDIFANAVRNQDYEYSSRVPAMVKMKQSMGEGSLALDLVESTISHFQELCRAENIEAIVRAARLLSEAREIYCLGLRSSFPVVSHFSHVAAYFQDNVRLVDGVGESGIMSLMNDIGQKDVLLVCGLAPYARRTVTLSHYLRQQKIRIVAITDNASSPLARLASETILVNKKSTSFFDSVTPAFLVSELLVALLAATSKTDVKASVNSVEEKLWAMGEWWSLV